MFCQECGAKLKDTAKFCGECGAKVERVEPTPDKQVIDSIALSELPKISSIATVPVEILEVNGEGPDGENNFNITVKCRFNNESDQEWHLLKIRTQLLNAFGQVIEESIDKQEEFIGADNQFEWETSFWSVNADLLGSEPEKVHVIVYVSASQKLVFELGQVHIPETSFDTVYLPVKNMEAMQLVSCNLWKGAVDDDKESRVEVRALLQNLTNTNVPLVKILAVVSDKQGDELITFDGDDELRAGELSVINASSYAKDKKLVGANIALSLGMYWFIATGIAQRQGMEILIPIDDTENYNKDCNDKSSNLVTPKEVKEIFNSLEDSMMEKSVLVGIAPSSMVAVSLTPEFYKDGVEKKLKCTINIECTEFEDLDDDTMEAISDAASDYFRDQDLKNDLDELGFEDILDWWPVKVVNVNDDENHTTTDNICGENGRTFYANMKWFKPAEQPESFDQLPSEFLKAKELWDADKDANASQIIDLINPFVGARFIASNISACEELFYDTEKDGLFEIEATKVRVVGIDFTENPIPICKAEAEFVVRVNANFDSVDHAEWQESNGPFTDAITFYWNIPESYGLEDLDLTYGDNSGVECICQSNNLINDVQMFEKEFHGARTVYSSNSIFIAILTNSELKYDQDVIGSIIFPDGFETVEPPGPSFGFGSIVLSEDEEDGKVVIADLKNREDEDGKVISSEALKESLEEYFDGFFLIDVPTQFIKQISFIDFYKQFEEEKDYKIIHFIEFEPDED